MLVLGLILLLCGYFFAVHFLFVLGIILLIVGAVLWFASAAGHSIGGRRFWY